MKFTKTKIEGVYIVELEPRSDERGSFARNFCKKELLDNGIDYEIVQINRAMTKSSGTIRGMHFQKPPKEESKIFQCIKGAIFYVAIDLRKDSPTYMQWVGEELNGENKKMIIVPKSFASGYQTLEDNTEVQYTSSEFYSPECESGVRFDDPSVNILWPIANPILSDKDKGWPLMQRDVTV